MLAALSNLTVQSIVSCLQVSTSPYFSVADGKIGKSLYLGHSIFTRIGANIVFSQFFSRIYIAKSLFANSVASIFNITGQTITNPLNSSQVNSSFTALFINECTFTNCTSETSAGAITIGINTEIFASIFKGCSGFEAGAILQSDGCLAIDGTSFSDCFSTDTADDSDVITDTSADGNFSFTFSNTTTISNSASSTSSSLRIVCPLADIEYSKFVARQSSNLKSVVFISSDSSFFTHCIFSNSSLASAYAIDMQLCRGAEIFLCIFAMKGYPMIRLNQSILAASTCCFNCNSSDKAITKDEFSYVTVIDAKYMDDCPLATTDWWMHTLTASAAKNDSQYKFTVITFFGIFISAIVVLTVLLIWTLVGTKGYREIFEANESNEEEFIPAE